MNTLDRSGETPMSRTEVVLFPEGTACQTVDLATWDFPDLTVFALMTNEPRLTKALTELQDAMTALITAVHQGRPLPHECYIRASGTTGRSSPTKRGWRCLTT